MNTNIDTNLVMVIVTSIYVVATIFICWANFKSANASKEQLKEMQRQHAETYRPLVELEFHYVRKLWYLVRFVNHGTLTAQHVRINIDQCFVNSLPEEAFKKGLEMIRGKECIIGVGQHYDLFIGSNQLRDNLNMLPLTGTIEYEAQGIKYKSDLFVDLEQYMTFFSVTTDEEDLHKSIKAIGDQMKSINRTLTNKRDEFDNDMKDH